MIKWQKLLSLCFILAAVLLFPGYSYAADYCVTGAGTVGVDGAYNYNALNYSYDHDGGTDFRLVYTGYAELRSGANPYIVPGTTDTGYYYNSSIGSTNFTAINTLNTGGSNPIPTIVASTTACDSPSLEREQTDYKDMALWNMIIIFELAFLPLGYVYTLVKPKKDD